MMQVLYSFDRYFAPVGRILVGVFFLLAGIGKLMGIAGTANYIASVGLPSPVILAWVVAIFELAAGLALITGFKAKCAALFLGIFTLMTAVLFHSPSLWPDNPSEQINFMKNIALMGALFFMSTHLRK